MTDEQKRIKAIIDEQIRLLKDNPKLKGKTDGQLWGAELNSRTSKSRMSDPEYRSTWQEKHKVGSQNRSQDPKWQENHKIGIQKRAYDLEWRENTKLANQKKAQDPKWQENQKNAIQKANNKAISCNGVIYESRKVAALVIAPETRITEHSKTRWLQAQMKKFPERYFYIDKDNT